MEMGSTAVPRRSLGRDVVIVGVGEVGIGRAEPTGGLRMHAQAAAAAAIDAGISLRDVDGVLTCNSYTEPYRQHSVVLAEYLGIEPHYTATLALGGASHAAMVGHAASAIATGVCDTVLIASADNPLTALSTSETVAKLAGWGHPTYELPYGPLMPAYYGLVAHRYMHGYGVIAEQIAKVAVTTRQHAALNPVAMEQKPLTIEQCLSARLIASPLRRYDCSLVSDGGGAVIVTTSERARDLGKPFVRILGVGEGHTHEYLSQARSLTTSGAATSGRRALEMAGVDHRDVDVATIYDCFTISVIALLEDLGFCAKGEGGQYVDAEGIGLDSRMPINTHGGLLSHAHPGPPGGIFHIVEAVRQLRGQCDTRQVADAEIALVHGMGGAMSTHCTLVLGGE